MAETKTERKVTIVLAADVVGYSTMMDNPTYILVKTYLDKIY